MVCRISGAQGVAGVCVSGLHAGPCLLPAMPGLVPGMVEEPALNLSKGRCFPA